MKFLLMSLLLVVSSAAQAQWTEEQKMLAATYMMAHVIDWGQTRHIAARPDRFKEGNPMLPKKPSNGRIDAHFIVTPIIGYVLLDSASSDTRTTALKVLNAIEWTVVAHNHSIGLRVRF